MLNIVMWFEDSILSFLIITLCMYLKSLKRFQAGNERCQMTWDYLHGIFVFVLWPLSRQDSTLRTSCIGLLRHGWHYRDRCISSLTDVNEVTDEFADGGAACYTFSIPKFDGQRVKAVINRPNDEAISR